MVFCKPKQNRILYMVSFFIFVLDVEYALQNLCSQIPGECLFCAVYQSP